MSFKEAVSNLPGVIDIAGSSAVPGRNKGPVVLIASLGLFGLTSFTLAQRTKEIYRYLFWIALYYAVSQCYVVL